MTEPTTIPVLVLTDPVEIVESLCEVGEWDLARRIARKSDEERRGRGALGVQCIST